MRKDEAWFKDQVRDFVRPQDTKHMLDQDIDSFDVNL